MSAITLRDLTEIPVARLKGVGDKKLASLTSVGIENVEDLKEDLDQALKACQ